MCKNEVKSRDEILPKPPPPPIPLIPLPQISPMSNFSFYNKYPPFKEVPIGLD